MFSAVRGLASASAAALPTWLIWWIQHR